MTQYIKTYKIYKLIDPVSKEIRYIGVTTRSLKQRLYQHCWEAKNKVGTHKRQWLKKLINSGNKPIIELVEKCNKNNWEDREKFWINYYNNLTNTLPGGCGIVFKNKSSIEQSSKNRKKKIIQLNLNGEFIKEWDSIKEAYSTLKLSRTSISNVLNGRSKTCQGFYFIYKELYSNLYNFKSTNRNKTSLKSDIIKVMYKDGTFKQFNTVKECAKYLNVSPTYVIFLIQKKRKINKSKLLSKVKEILRYSLDFTEM